MGIACRKRRIKCGEERPTCSNCVKSKRNCEGYTPRVIFKDPLGAYRPVSGSTQSSGAQFQSISSQTEGTGSVIRTQSGATSQAALPPIAPRPSPPIQQNGTVQAPSVISQGSTTEQYGLFGYSFDGQTYGQAFSENEMPSHVPPNLQHQRSSFDHDRVSPKTESTSRSRLGSMQQPKLQHRSTGESDSGVDMTFAGYSSHSPTSSSGPPAIPFYPQTQEISPITFDQPPRPSVDHPLDALFPPYIDQILPEQYHNPDHTYYAKGQWPFQPPNTDHHSFGTVDNQVHANPISRSGYPDSMTSVQGLSGKIFPCKKVVAVCHDSDIRQ